MVGILTARVDPSLKDEDDWGEQNAEGVFDESIHGVEGA